MLLPQRRITFTNTKTGNDIVYDYVCDIEINRSLDVLTDTATITIPRKLVFKSGDALTLLNQNDIKDYVTLPSFNDTEDTAYVVGADALFKRGDKVKIEIGYYPNLQTRFTGYITDISSTLPITITCEDKMWLLKQSNVVFPDDASYVNNPRPKNTDKTKDFYTLQQVLDGILSTVSEKIMYSTTLGSFNVGNKSYNNQSAAQVLETLKDTYGLYSHFKDDGILYVSFYNDASSNNVQEFVMEDVVINNDSLEWSNLEDIAVKVRGVSVNSDGSTIAYEKFNRGALLISQYDDEKTDNKSFSGETIVRYTQNQDKESLKKWVDNLFLTYAYTGFRGDIETLGEPFVNHGDVCQLTSTKLPERNGYYLIKAIKIKDGKDGYFMTLTPGIKLIKK